MTVFSVIQPESDTSISLSQKIETFLSLSELQMRRVKPRSISVLCKYIIIQGVIISGHRRKDSYDKTVKKYYSVRIFSILSLYNCLSN